MKERINLIVSPKTRGTIELIQERLDLGSISEVIRRGISLLDILSKYEADGSTVFVRKDGKETQIKML
jgi:hypothetical protein